MYVRLVMIPMVDWSSLSNFCDPSPHQTFDKYRINSNDPGSLLIITKNLENLTFGFLTDLPSEQIIKLVECATISVITLLDDQKILILDLAAILRLMSNMQDQSKMIRLFLNSMFDILSKTFVRIELDKFDKVDLRDGTFKLTKRIIKA